MYVYVFITDDNLRNCHSVRFIACYSHLPIASADPIKLQMHSRTKAIALGKVFVSFRTYITRLRAQGRRLEKRGLKLGIGQWRNWLTTINALTGTVDTCCEKELKQKYLVLNSASCLRICELTVCTLRTSLKRNNLTDRNQRTHCCQSPKFPRANLKHSSADCSRSLHLQKPSVLH